MSRDRRYGSARAEGSTPVGRVLHYLGLGGSLGRRRTAALWRELQQRGADRDLVRWARPFGRDVAGAWRACPRGAWAIETAARAGVERTLVARAVEDCVRHADERALFVDPATREQLERCTGAWLQATLETRAWVTAVEAFLLEAVDSDPEVRRTRHRVEQAHRWGDRAGMVAASNAYDEAYLAARKRFANAVAARIPADAITTALHGLARHPYR